MTRLLLVGAGHAHAQVLRSWAQQPVPGVELVLVSPGPLAPYSGMVPGWLGGAYAWREICIDVAALAAAAGARLLATDLVALDATAQTATLASGEVLAWDWLSLNTGSTLEPPADLGAPVLALRPLARLQPAWDAALAAHADGPAGQPLRLMAVGGGAAGFESLLAARARLLALRPDRPVQATLVSRGRALLPGLAPGAVAAATRVLQRTGVQLQLGTACTAATAAGQHLLLWATGALAQPWQRDAARRGGLAVDAGGFIQVDARLRSVSHPRVFAVGDCAAFQPALAKAGVFAVRQGPVLTAQLRAAVAGGPPPDGYVPQQRFLVLLATGDGRAIASRGRLWASGRWVWRWKDRIDRGFLGGFAPGHRR
ncbi:FAD-dependent oxidoreductase [Pseudaquabacterium pictum]|uniref:Pyridine nucleotide-disulfide oxidoreductase n=1 Tax=Pseudaquabacterium pictum TaxID=2315236 RepID=A0A480AWX8_9BURK|nr:FAD-dependent oxidoreductase [Rubrivivax pictus]GCL63298.1 pyridine nucleotide-disulfide oxidoreductase [Rubrivivax pictus]